MTVLLPKEFNQFIVNANYLVVQQLIRSGHKIVMGRGAFGDFDARAITIIVAIDQEAEILANSGPDLLEITARAGITQRSMGDVSPN